ncbi:Thylakoid lumenal 17.4 kDa protein, chloroplastic-like protein [Drosera capensis]
MVERDRAEIESGISINWEQHFDPLQWRQILGFCSIETLSYPVSKVPSYNTQSPRASFKNTVLSGSTFDDAQLQDAIFEDTIIGYIDLQKICTNKTKQSALMEELNWVVDSILFGVSEQFLLMNYRGKGEFDGFNLADTGLVQPGRWWQLWRRRRRQGNAAGAV